MSPMEPGLYRATVRGIPGESIVMVGVDENATFSLATDGGVRRCYVFTDAVPLIVLSAPEDARDNHYPRLVAFLRGGGWDLTADQIEAQTKPARIPEPGKWGVVYARLVNASTWESWLRHPGEGWHPIRGGGASRWSDLIDPVLIREGI